VRDRVGFGLIGLGQIHRAHSLGYEQAQEWATVVAVCDQSEPAVRERAAAFGCPGYRDVRELLDDPRVEAVDITLPHNLHYDVARAALERGKHVLVEKPMAGTSVECLELIALASARNLTFTVAENTRFVRAYLEVEKLLRAGVLGKPRLIRTLISGSEVSRLSDSRLWKGRRDGTLGGAIFDAGPHSFFLLEWLFGEVRTVQAFASKLVPKSEVEDNALVAGRLDGGALFSTEYTFTAEIPWNERLEVYGSTGSVIVDQLCDPPAVHFRGAGDYTPVPLPGVPFEPQRWKYLSVAEEIKDFAQAVWAGRPPSIDPMLGYRAVLIAEKAYASVGASGRPVDVPGRSRSEPRRVAVAKR
jgi:predicted dehydrogenase